MDNFGIIIQAFLGVLLFGITGFFLVFLIRNMFAPKKITTLRNYIKAGNYKNAVSMAKDILSKNKSNPEAHFLLGEAYYNLQKPELALMEYKTAERSGSYTAVDEKKLRERLADLYFKTDNVNEALKEYIMLIKNNPTEHEYYFKTGELFQSKGQPTQAIKYYAYAIKLNKHHVPSLINIGILLFESKKYQEAQKYLLKSVSADSSNFRAFFYLGKLESALNNHKGALKHYEKSLRDKEYKIRSLVERGKIFMIMGKYDEAIIELDRALKNSEEEDNIKLNIRYILASCFELKRNLTEAITLWEKIYELKPGFKDVADKLTNYQDLRMDDRMKDFMTATDADFLDMSKGIVEHMGLNVLDVDILNKDSIEIACLEPDDKWRNVKKRPKIIHLSRKTVPIDEATIRNLHEKMREQGVIRGLVISSSGYSKLAKAFVKERPIELIDKNGLQEILKQANISPNMER